MSKCKHDWNMAEIGVWHCWKCKHNILARKPDDYDELENLKLWLERIQSGLDAIDCSGECQAMALGALNNIDPSVDVMDIYKEVEAKELSKQDSDCEECHGSGCHRCSVIHAYSANIREMTCEIHSLSTSITNVIEKFEQLNRELDI